MMFDILLELPESKETPLWAYGLVVEIYGKKDGQDRKITYWSEHPSQEVWGGKAAYYKNIAIPLSVGAIMMARGDVTERGIIAPETAIPPDIFFAELEKRGIVIHERVEDL
jgi:lysine 6-dehydrogenase